MKYIPLILICILLQTTACSQAGGNKETLSLFRVAFYNVENLFDTLDDPEKNDADFLPSGRIPWTDERYQLKLDRLSQVIDALAAGKPAAVIGLCEVENRQVLHDLVHSPSLQKYNYSFIHIESPDERGIDNALLYDARQFQPIASRALPVDLSPENGDATRDILYVKGIPLKSKKDTLHIFINHWPSRSEGREISDPKRRIAAETLKMATDSILRLHLNSLVIALGDFNDEPPDASLSKYLQAMPPEDSPASNSLYNLMYPAFSRGEGTLYWKDWDVFDQVILSGNFWLKQKGIRYSGKEAMIFKEDFLLFKSNDGTLRPNRTAARDYYGGYSDHLPVYIDLQMK